MDFAAGCWTTISRRIAFPSLVITMPPIGSINIWWAQRRGQLQRKGSEVRLATDLQHGPWTETGSNDISDALQPSESGVRSQATRPKRRKVQTVLGNARWTGGLRDSGQTQEQQTDLGCVDVIELYFSSFLLLGLGV